MANICETAVAFYATSDKYADKLTDFHDKLTCMQREISRLQNFDSLYIAPKFGISRNRIEWSYIQDISAIEAHGTYRGFKVWQDDRWSPNLSLWDAIIEHDYTTDDGDRMLDYVYIAEEPGCGIYINTDIDGEFFCDLYKVDAYLPNELFDGEYLTEYFSNTSDLNDLLEKLTRTIPECYKAAKMPNESYEDCINDYIQINYPDRDYYFYINKFEDE